MNNLGSSACIFDKSNRIVSTFLSLLTTLLWLSVLSHGTILAQTWDNDVTRYDHVSDWCSRLQSASRNVAQDLSVSDQDVNPFTLVAIDPNYFEDGKIAVVLTSRKNIKSLMVQARAVTSIMDYPLGRWDVLPEITTGVSCSKRTKDSVMLDQSLAKDHIVLRWNPVGISESAKFVAVILDSDNKEWIVTSHVVHPFPQGHATNRDPTRVVVRRRRDVNMGDVTTWSPENVTSWTDDVTSWTDNVTSFTDDVTTEVTKTGPDVGAYFTILTIVGAYIGMYMIFAFLLI